MGEALQAHRAGESIQICPNTLFRRDTDRFVKKMLGKQSLDVGADRIARTAFAALKLLNEISELTGKRISMAWGEGQIEGVSCIEVYPAATLEASGLSSRGYKGKKPEHRAARKEMISGGCGFPKLGHDLMNGMEANDDAFDAGVCLLAAADFLRGSAMGPEDMETAVKEGWIWVRARPGNERP